VAKVVNNDEVLVDLADNVRVRIVRSTIAQVLAKTEPAKEAKKETEAPANDEGVAPGASEDAKTPAWRRMLGLH
jgi:preprotein translocase subunit YajC